MAGQEEVIKQHQQEQNEEQGCSTQTIIKGKRTKRQRPQSPIPFRMITQSHQYLSNSNSYTKSSDISSPHQNFSNATTTTDEEEEDMANCLILLAQGRPEPVYPKFTSRKFMDSGGGYYVYQCKTCGKTFPSFQALGGHRASHKKPKFINTNKFSNEEQPPKATVISTSVSLSLQLNSRPGSIVKTNSTRTRVHECTICGAGFSSGQALGGHMRRHRRQVSATAPPVTVAERARSCSVSLDLDLNLPATAEDHVENCHSLKESKLVFASKQPQPQPQQPTPTPTPTPSALPHKNQQKQLVFSSPALVDCHY